MPTISKREVLDTTILENPPKEPTTKNWKKREVPTTLHGRGHDLDRLNDSLVIEPPSLEQAMADKKSVDEWLRNHPRRFLGPPDWGEVKRAGRPNRTLRASSSAFRADFSAWVRVVCGGLRAVFDPGATAFAAPVS